MKQYYRRKVTPKVKSGIVQRKNRHKYTARLGYVIDRESPARGCRHVVTKRDIRDFISIIPNWAKLSEGIQGILLSSGSGDYEGLYEHFHRESTGIIELSAWEGDLWAILGEDYFFEHRHIFDMLGVAYEEVKTGWECRFTLTQAKAFMLLHVFMHELGHHVDRMRTKNKKVMKGGHEFAERCANEWLDRLWPEYISKFGVP